ncbi:Uncharacterized conserved protein YqgV, UPF0045/DUF77 family [Tindallia magadiensis]|uniref:Uncharacterized conserved protein YqgV, UPF0045/DUF77 family n=1 Tax=Tindallia magadiensis TaxID=69895 RepID=A0A1I3H5G2_9FIRM|nr:YkoF family thiamine/hydroxymethylpyrimidine-binding protein [Tindallia magadiensis]SFI30852.1 Uncharacterized conserved protein YqgV, UPF0045/DUF77 family [Tindallia magadiensis]
MSKNPMCCGTSPFFGCRFSLYPMTNQFVPVILDAIEEINRPGLKVETDMVSTCLTGVERNVFAALRDSFARAAATGEHVVMTATFSKGCPGEGEVNLEEYDFPAETDFTAKEGCDREVNAQFSVYPLGNQSYMKLIGDVVDRMKQAGVYQESVHFCTSLEGSIANVFEALEEAFSYVSKEVGHTVMTATFSCNSPSKK